MSLEQPQNIRVFVSSTFLDLFPEREYLVKHVFPELRHICRERGLLFTEVDLRWGLTYEDASFGRVISTCLQEIDRCRPFFIGVLGERYGWVPELGDIHKNANLLDEHRWIEEAVLEGESLVEMEFNYAVLNSSASMPGASFYILDRPDSGIFPMTALEEKRLDRLRDRIYDCKRPVRTFHTPEELGALVRDDLLRAIDVLHPARTERTPLARERRLHEAFSLSRRQAYVARQETLQRLSDHVASDDPPLVVHGVSGLGKSALLAYWARFYGQRHPDTIVVTHFVGSVSSDEGHESIVRRVLMEIKEALHLEEELPQSLPAMEALMTEWLAKVPNGRMVLVIDALNQLGPNEYQLSWLPKHLPPNVRIIVSTTPGPTLDELKSREWPMFELQPLTVRDREAMITRFLSEFQKSLPFTKCQWIAKDEKTASPLFLRTLLEELRLFGTFEKLDERIEYYLTTRDTSDLFQRVLERMEADFGEHLIANVMRSVWASREGLTEQEFLAINAISRADASQLLIALEYHLVQREGHIRFFHDHLREAVERKYLSNDELRAAAHGVLAKFYLGEPSSSERALELPYQLAAANMLDELHAWLTDLGEFMRYATDEEQWRFIGYWLPLDGKFSRAESYKVALGEYAKHATVTDHAMALEHVGGFLVQAGDTAAAEEMLSAAMPVIEANFGADDEGTIGATMTYGELLQSLAKYRDAEPVLRSTIERFERRFGTDDLRVARALESTARNLYSQGKYEEAEAMLQRSLAIRDSHEDSSIATKLEVVMDIGVMQYSTRRYEEAAATFETVMQQAEQSLGTQHPTYASAASNLAAVNIAQNKPELASKLLELALTCLIKNYGEQHGRPISCLISLGHSKLRCGDLIKAEAVFRQALTILQAMNRIDVPEYARVQLNLGQTLFDKNAYGDAYSILLDALDRFTLLLGNNHHNTIQTAIALAKTCNKLGRHFEAVALYDQYLHKIDDLTVLEIATGRYKDSLNEIHKLRM